jgi:carboxyl-terminal processing protease
MVPATLVMRITFAISVLIFFACCRPSSAQSAAQQKAFLVKRVIELNHFSPRAVDDSFSTRLFRKMINTVDTRRLLFTDNEYKSLAAYSLRLDDELKGSGWGFLSLFTILYKKSLARADSILNAVLQKPFDFTVDETIGISGDITYSFAAGINELYNRWSRYLKFMALEDIYNIIADDSVNTNFSKEAIAKLEGGVRNKLKTTQRKGMKKMLEAEGFDNLITGLYLNAVATSFDPHSNYFSPEGKEAFQSALSAEGLSFGLIVDEDEKGKIIIDRLVPGGPAWKSGELHKGDELLQLNWENKEQVDIVDLTLEEIYDMLESPVKERLVLKVKKADGSVTVVALKKEKISNEENIVKSFVLKGEKKIGYILLPGFYTEWENESGSGCANDVAKEIIKLKRDHIDGLIVDVRFNGGGSVQEGLEMTGIFVDEGPLAGQKSATGKVAYYKDPNRGVIYNGPLALMINGQSASASEMMAASLQDYNRAVIIGSNSFGKATVQRMLPLDTNYRENGGPPGNTADVVKVTFGKFYRLDGRSAQLKGVVPDIILPDAFDGLDIGERFFKNALPADTIQKNNYYKPLPSLPVDELAKKSAERIKSNNDFQSIQKLVASHVRGGNTAIKTIPLKWDSFEKWMRQQQLDRNIIKGESTGSDKKFVTGNNQHDKQWLEHNEYEREINQKWLENIAEDIYIREAFLVVCDLINLYTTSPKN